MHFSSMGDTSADEVKKRDRSPSLNVTNKATYVEGEYNFFTITPFHLFILCIETFHRIAVSPCKHGCVLCAQFRHIHFTISLYQSYHRITITPCEHVCVFSAPFCHIFLTIALYQSISPSRHFTFLPLFHTFTAKRRKKAALEQRAIELFGSCGSDEGDSKEGVGKKNLY